MAPPLRRRPPGRLGRPAPARPAEAVHRRPNGRVQGVVGQTCGIAPFARLAALAMGQEPYASAKRVFWVVDNGSSCRGGWAQDRLQTAWPNAQLVHASWPNQIEVFFSILARESFPDTDALAERILHFQRWHNQTARPFNWTWTRQRLNDHLHRLGGFNLDA